MAARKPKLPCRSSGVPPSAVGGSAELRVVEPCAAPDHAKRTRSRADGIGRDARRIFLISVPAPLPHVPVHIVKPPAVRPFLGRHLRFPSAVSLMPTHLIQLSASGIRPSRPRPAGILPLRLGRQIPYPACGQGLFPVHLRQPDLDIVPTHLLHWQVRAFEMARIVSHHALPLDLRRLRLRQPETPRQGHPMPRFSVETPLLAAHQECPIQHLELPRRRTPHREAPRRAPDHLDPPEDARLARLHPPPCRREEALCRIRRAAARRWRRGGWQGTLSCRWQAS